MKATLEFDLPEDDYDHKAAIFGHDALALIHDLEEEIRAFVSHDAGNFKHWRGDEGKDMKGCYDTLQRVWDWIIREKQERNLPNIV